ncbi:hypothetical protein Sste5346_007953 [Sporothrix stenoceras]|uniref:Uncharacterized protein n=1 Tax=Sporothrix stenoceras TaxID=5173 RepID=A0ABR3YRL7_9PEZI
MATNESSDGPTVAETVIETVPGVGETTITTIKADTNGASTTVTTTAFEVKESVAPANAVTEVKTDATPVEPVAEAAPTPTKAASTPAKMATALSKATAATAKTTKAPVKAAATKTSTPAKPDTPAKTAAKPAAKPTAKTAPPGYKLIKVKNADGKIIVVKKKLTEAELAAAAEKKGEAAVKPDNTASEQTKSVEYKIVSIPQSDGTLVKVRRAVHAEDVAGKAKAAPKPKAPIAKDGEAATVSEKEVEADDEAPISDAKRKEMVSKQKHKFRMGRTRKYRRTMLRGFAMQLIGELPSIEIDSHGFQDGDQVISDDDSDLDFDSDSGDHDLFGHHDHDDDDNDSIIGGGDGHGNGHDAGHDDNAGASGSGSHIEISTEAIGKTVYDNVAAQTNKKKPAVTATAVEVPPPVKTKDIPAPAAAAAAKPKASEKVTYKMADKDLEKLDEDKPSSELQHHWENISFYMMASLSIILPMLFVRK